MDRKINRIIHESSLCLRKNTGPVVIVAAALLMPLVLGGCTDDDPGRDGFGLDLHAPAIPAGVRSITGDGAVYVRWIPNKESDLAGYRVWWDGDGDEKFEELAVVGAFEDGVYFDNGTRSAGDDFLEYADILGFSENGTYNSYAVTSFDDAGNESDLSWESVIDVPRPEGYNLRLENRTDFPALSGYDLSSLSEQSQPWNAGTTDVWFDFGADDIPRLFVPQASVRILDAGFQGDDGFAGLDGVDEAPTKGWSRSGVVEAIEGHTYVLRILGPDESGILDNYAKIWVGSMSGGGADLWWAYQEVRGETQFGTPPPDRPSPKEFAIRQEVVR